MDRRKYLKRIKKYSDNSCYIFRVAKAKKAVRTSSVGGTCWRCNKWQISTQTWERNAEERRDAEMSLLAEMLEHVDDVQQQDTAASVSPVSTNPLHCYRHVDTRGRLTATGRKSKCLSSVYKHITHQCTV